MAARRAQPEESARAYLRNLPQAELHLLEGAGHWLLETHFEEALPLVRGFLERVASPGGDQPAGARHSR